MSLKTPTTDMTKAAKPELLPKLRFPEFREATGWKHKTLAEICLQITNGKANAQDHEADGDYPLFDRSAVIKKSNEFRFDAEAVILPGEGMRFVPKYFKGKFNLHQRAYALMSHQGDGRFVYHSLDYLQDALAKRAVKSTVLSLRLPIVQDFVIGCPELAEQQKIADCLSSVDELIAAQARKVDALKTHKKGLMQQLFPREGETQPRQRFPEFWNSGQWNVKPLESFSKVGDIDHRMPSSVADGIPYIMTGDFFGINRINFDSSKKISAEDYEQLSKKIRPEFGDIVIARYASVGAVRHIETSIKFLVSYSCAIIKCDRSENSKYLYYIIQSDVIQSQIGLNINTSSQKNIGIDSIKKLSIFLPTLPEQQKVADCLATLDTLITAETQKLDALKTHKKGLMQQLFPSAEAVPA